MTTGRWLGVGLLGAALVALGVLGARTGVAVGLIEWLRGAGALGVLVFAGVYVLGALLMLPGSVLTMGAGFVYGPLWGSVLVSPVSVVVALAGFAIARRGGRARVARWLGASRRLAAIDAAVGQRGLLVVVLLRLSPVLPFAALNYGLGLTRVRRRDYLLGSAIGMLPATILYVYLGAALTEAGQLTGSGATSTPLAQAALWAGLLATALVTIVITRQARRALAQLVPPDVAPDKLSSPSTSRSAA